MLELISDWVLWAPVLFGLSFGQQESNQQSTSSQSRSENKGLPDPLAQKLSEYIEPRIRQTYLPFAKTQLETPFALPKLTPEGVYAEQVPSLQNIVNQGVSRASSNLAQRGFLSPQNAPFVAGQGIQDVVPQFLSGVGQNVERQVLEPELERRRRVADYLALLEQAISGIGAEGSFSNVAQGSQGSSGFNFGLG